MILVFSVGGSILSELEPQGMRKFADALQDIAADHQVFVVVGGGKAARDYIQKARMLDASEAFCDQIGISVTKINAMLLIAALGGSAPPVPLESYSEALQASRAYKIVVLGGLSPGQTTDAVAALLAEYVHADRMIVATSVDGVYTANPEIDPSAEKYNTLTSKDLVFLSMDTELKAGSRSPIDPLAAKIIERSGIPTAVVYGGDVLNLRKGVEGNHKGTEII
jgi:uridylate kinase